jgi:hypothetical protein
MAFKIAVTGVGELSQHQYITEVVIERRIYDHSRATLVMEWEEETIYKDRSTASIAAKTLNCPSRFSGRTTTSSRVWTASPGT